MPKFGNDAYPGLGKLLARIPVSPDPEKHSKSESIGRRYDRFVIKSMATMVI